MEIPQILVIVIFSLGLGISMNEHGKPKEGTNNAWFSIASFVITMGLLWWGGFFK